MANGVRSSTQKAAHETPQWNSVENSTPKIQNVAVDSPARNADILGDAFKDVVVNLWEKPVPDQETVH